MADLASYPEEFRDILDTSFNTIDVLMNRLKSGDITPGQWFERMMLIIERAHEESMLSGSDLGEITPDMQGVIDNQLLVQAEFLRNFENEYIEDGWKESFFARGRMYGSSAYAAYSHGNIIAQAGKVLPLPAYPTEGTQCLCISTGDSRVFTSRGYIPIRDVLIGDYVITHKLRWKKVTATHTRKPKEQEEYLNITMPTGEILGCTLDHKWLTQKGWIASIDIYNKGNIVYNVPYEKMSKMQREVRKPKQNKHLQRLQKSLSVWSKKRLPSGNVSILHKLGYGKISMVNSGWTIKKTYRLEEFREKAKGKVFGFVGKWHKLAKEIRREILQLLLGFGKEKIYISLPISMDIVEWGNTEGVSYPSHRWEKIKRQIKEFRVNEFLGSFKPAYDKISYEENDRSERASIQFKQKEVIENKVYLPELQEKIYGISKEWSFSPQILLKGLLHSETTLYDLTVEDDHSFIIEGVITHNSNCKCNWQIDVLDFESGDFDGYWQLGTDDNCQTCVQRAQEWNPVQIREGVLL